MRNERLNQEFAASLNAQNYHKRWIYGGLSTLLVGAAVASFFIFYGGSPKDHDKIRFELQQRMQESKAVFSATARDRILSEVIEDSMEGHYYDIARDAASFISMPMIRRGMYKRIAEHCIRANDRRPSKECLDR